MGLSHVHPTRKECMQMMVPGFIMDVSIKHQLSVSVSLSLSLSVAM